MDSQILWIAVTPVYGVDEYFRHNIKSSRPDPKHIGTPNICTKTIPARKLEPFISERDWIHGWFLINLWEAGVFVSIDNGKNLEPFMKGDYPKSALGKRSNHLYYAQKNNFYCVQAIWAACNIILSNQNGSIFHYRRETIQLLRSWIRVNIYCLFQNLMYIKA